MFDNELCRQALDLCIERLLHVRASQHGLDTVYSEFIDSVKYEMNHNMEYKDVTPGMNKRHKRIRKPFWNDILRKKWKLASQKDREFRRFADDVLFYF